MMSQQKHRLANKIFCNVNDIYIYILNFYISGTSDPYVKFKIGNKLLYKSKTIYKNLNPQWNETFNLLIEDLFKPIQIQVFDYDRGRFDDPMGSAEIDLSSVELNE